MWSQVVVYLAAVNAVTFVAFALDKHWARAGAWRVPERTLLTLALAGGTPAATAAQQLLRHKTRKEPFRTLLWMTWAVQAAALAAALVYLRSAV